MKYISRLVNKIDGLIARSKARGVRQMSLGQLKADISRQNNNPDHINAAVSRSVEAGLIEIKGAPTQAEIDEAVRVATEKVMREMSFYEQVVVFK